MNCFNILEGGGVLPPFQLCLNFLICIVYIFRFLFLADSFLCVSPWLGRLCFL
jgi:hypothetical protein